MIREIKPVLQATKQILPTRNFLFTFQRPANQELANFKFKAIGVFL